MNQTFKQYLFEQVKEQKSSKINITLANKDDDSNDVEVELLVDYQLVEDDQGRENEKMEYIVDPESIEYIVNEPFEFNGVDYKKGFDLYELYDNIYVDDKYKNDSQFLRQNVKDYFIKDTLADDKKDDVFLHLLELMISEQK